LQLTKQVADSVLPQVARPTIQIVFRGDYELNLCGGWHHSSPGISVDHPQMHLFVAASSIPMVWRCTQALSLGSVVAVLPDFRRTMGLAPHVLLAFLQSFSCCLKGCVYTPITGGLDTVCLHDPGTPGITHQFSVVVAGHCLHINQHTKIKYIVFDVVGFSR